MAGPVYGDHLLARRYNESDIHPDMAVLTGQTLEPHDLPQPVLAPKEKLVRRKIVGTIFAGHAAPPPATAPSREFAPVPNFALVQSLLRDARLLEVKGRSAEPIALDGQFLITRPARPAADSDDCGQGFRLNAAMRSDRRRPSASASRPLRAFAFLKMSE
jgi:hypothetical protein